MATNYNNDTMSIDQPNLYKIANEQLTARITAYFEQLTALTKAWDSIPSNWAGETAVLATAFFERYNTLGRRLFGTGKESLNDEAAGDAVLPRIGAAVMTAARNFDAAETGIVEGFGAFSNPATGKDDGNRGPGVGPVTETN